MPTSNAGAVWEGVLRSNRGHFTAGTLEGDYSNGTPATRYPVSKTLQGNVQLELDARLE